MIAASGCDCRIARATARSTRLRGSRFALAPAAEKPWQGGPETTRLRAEDAALVRRAAAHSSMTFGLTTLPWIARESGKLCLNVSRACSDLSTPTATLTPSSDAARASPPIPQHKSAATHGLAGAGEGVGRLAALFPATGD